MLSTQFINSFHESLTRMTGLMACESRSTTKDMRTEMIYLLFDISRQFKDVTLTVNASDGVTTLQGVVANATQALLAERLAAKACYGGRVVNNISQVKRVSANIINDDEHHRTRANQDSVNRLVLTTMFNTRVISETNINIDNLNIEIRGRKFEISGEVESSFDLRSLEFLLDELRGNAMEVDNFVKVVPVIASSIKLNQAS